MGQNLTFREILVVRKERNQARGGYYEKLSSKILPHTALILFKTTYSIGGNVHVVSYTKFTVIHMLLTVGASH